MNWNDPNEIADESNVFVLLDTGCIQQAWFVDRWYSIKKLNGTVVGWLSIDDYIQQTKAEIDRLTEIINKAKYALEDDGDAAEDRIELANVYLWRLCDEEQSE